MWTKKGDFMIKKKYKPGKGLIKGLYTAAAIGIGISSALAIAAPAITTGTITTAITASAIGGGITFAINWWKQNYKE
jgi:hypothetical protein